MNIDSAFELFIQDKTLYTAPATVAYYENVLHRFRLFLVDNGIIDTDSLSVDVLKLFLASLRASNVKSTSIHTYFRGIKNFCSWGILEGILPPFNYKLKLPRPDPALNLPLSASEAFNILKYIETYCSPDKILFFRLLLDCGLRCSEALSLSYDCFDFDNQIIHINYSKFDKCRIVPAPASVLSLIDPECSGSLFEFSDSGKSSFFARLQKSCNIPRLHAHLLRHTFATSYLMKHNNLEYLRNYLGHASYDVTRIYCNLAFQLQLTHYDIYEIDDIFL